MKNHRLPAPSTWAPAFAALAAVATLALAAPRAHAADYMIEPTHTAAMFEIPHFGASMNRVRFDKESGTVQFDPAARTGRVDLTIDAASLSSGVAAFDRHLKDADIFDVEKYPTIRFVAEQFQFDGDKVASVTGTLTIKDQTHPVTLKATQFGCYQSPMFKREVCGGNFEGVIDRTQWGLGYAANAAGKEVKLIAAVEAVRQ